MKGLALLGAGGTASDILDWGLPVVGFHDDRPDARLGDLPHLGPLRATWQHDHGLVNSLGSPRSFRQRPALTAALPVERFVTLIHPAAQVSPRARIGLGCLVYPLTFVGPEAELEEHVTMLPHSAVHHHSRIGAFTLIASGVMVSGNVRVGRSCYLGTGALLRDGIQVADETLVAMGAVLVKDATGPEVLGHPARPRH